MRARENRRKKSFKKMQITYLPSSYIIPYTKNITNIIYRGKGHMRIISKKLKNGIRYPIYK